MRKKSWRVCRKKKDKIIKNWKIRYIRKLFKGQKETGKLLKRWKPKVIKGTVRFGFEDPCHTGQALAAFSIIYPFIGEFLSIEPNFERRILKGDIKVRGGFRMVPLVLFPVESGVVQGNPKDLP